jgi:hypothetical protein
MSEAVNNWSLTGTKERVVSDKSLFEMDIDLVKARFDARLKSTVLLSRLVLNEIGIPERILKMLLDHFEKWEDFADRRNLRLRKFEGCILEFL